MKRVVFLMLVGLAVTAPLWTETLVPLRSNPAILGNFAVEFSTGNALPGAASASTTTFTTTANSSLLTLFYAWRNTASQTASSYKVGTQSATLSSATTVGSVASGNAYLLSPTVGSSSATVAMSASCPGLASAVVSFQGASAAPTNAVATIDNANTSFTSTVTVTSNVGDVIATAFFVQGSSLTKPVITTAGTTEWHASTCSATGNGGWLQVITTTATTTSTQVNVTWSPEGRRVAANGFAVPRP